MVVPFFLRFLAEDCLERRCDVRDLRCSNFPDFVILNRLAAVFLVLSFGMLIWSQYGVYKLMFLPWRLFDFGYIGQSFNHPVDFFKPNFWVGNLPTSELDSQFNLVTFFQKFPGPIDSNLQIVRPNAGPEPQLFGSGGFGFLFGLALLSLFGKSVLFEIQNPNYRRFGLGGDLNQIQPQVLGFPKGFCYRQNANLLAVLVDNTNFGTSDLKIEPWPAFFYLSLTSKRIIH